MDEAEATLVADTQKNNSLHGRDALADRWLETDALEDVLEELEEGSVVEYMLPASETEDDGCTLGLGFFTSEGMGAEPHIRPLCRWADDLGTCEMVSDEEADAVPLAAISRLLDPDVVYTFEKQMGGGLGMGNPNGTEGQICFDLSDVQLSEGVRVVTREELEVWF